MNYCNALAILVLLLCSSAPADSLRPLREDARVDAIGKGSSIGITSEIEVRTRFWQAFFKDGRMVEISGPRNKARFAPRMPSCALESNGHAPIDLRVGDRLAIEGVDSAVRESKGPHPFAYRRTYILLKAESGLTTIACDTPVAQMPTVGDVEQIFGDRVLFFGSSGWMAPAGERADITSEPGEKTLVSDSAPVETAPENRSSSRGMTVAE